VEEVARCHGYDRLTDRNWNAAGLAAQQSPTDRLLGRIRDAWVGLGFNEMQNPVLSDADSHRRAGHPDEEMGEQGIHVPEPQSTVPGLMRLSPLPGPLASVARNQPFGRGEGRAGRQSLYWRPSFPSRRG